MKRPSDNRHNKSKRQLRHDKKRRIIEAKIRTKEDKYGLETTLHKYAGNRVP